MVQSDVQSKTVSPVPPSEANSLIGIALCVAAFAVLPAMDTVAKYLSADMSVIQVSWGRYFFHLMFLLPVVLYRYGPSAMKPARFFLQIVRGSLLLSATLCFFASIAIMPIADTLAIVFVSPLLVTLLSPFMLGERIGPYRVVAVLVGFVGTLIIIRPGNGMNIGALFALGTGVSYAFYSITTRKLSGSAPPIVTLTFTALVGSIVLSAAVPFFWSDISLINWGLMVLMGFLGALGQYFFIKAYDYAEASILAPITYSEIVMAVAFGWMVFGDFPDLWTWTGTAIVIASGIFISIRERSRTKFVHRVDSDTPPDI